MYEGDTQETITNIPLNNIDRTTTVLNLDSKKELYLKPCGGFLGNYMFELRRIVGSFIQNNIAHVTISAKLLIIACICVYIAFFIKNFVDTGAYIDWCHGYGKAFVIFGVILWCFIYYKWLKYYILPVFDKLTDSFYYIKYKRYVKYLIQALLAAFVIVFLILDTAGYRRRLISLLGIIFFLLVSFIFSKHPQYIRWDTTISGIILQIIFGIMAIRWETGRDILECFSNNIVTFLNYGQEGATFVYGEFLIKNNVFAFQALSTLYFLAMISRMLFHLGWLQKFCFKIGGFIEFILGTTVIESVYAATVIFLGMSEAPLICAPYIQLLTASEIHALMTSGFATVAGTLFAAYASLGVDPRYVLTASLMAAPASLCFAKLMYPENALSRTSSETIETLESEDTSIVDAACKGASSATHIVLGIIASVIACISFVAFVNGVLGWLGMLVGAENVTLEFIVGEIFKPIAWLMGVVPEECHAVGSLIGIKTIANEFVAYNQLGEMIKKGEISERSEAIATFALCGFSNPGALGINIATLSALADSRADSIKDVAIRAFVTGCITTFTSACIAGLLTEVEGYRGPLLNSTTVA